jgi:hypothetical protein
VIYIINNYEKVVYLNHLVGRIYKILPLSEDNNNNIPQLYIERLLDDIISANSLFDGLLILIVTQLNILNINVLSHKKTKSIVFDCINTCKKIIKEIESNETITES